MSPAQMLPFLLLSMALTIAPGPDNMSIISYGLSRGRRPAMWFGAGCSAGCLLHTFWLAIGLSGLIATSAAAFGVLKTAGAFYLFYLGYRALCTRELATARTPGKTEGLLSNWTYFRRGFAANAINPKVAIFFLSFLPEFTQPAALPYIAQFLILGSLFAAQSFAIFLCIGACSGVIGEFLRTRAFFGIWLDRFAGAIFVFLGLTLLFAQVRRQT